MNSNSKSYAINKYILIKLHVNYLTIKCIKYKIWSFTKGANNWIIKLSATQHFGDSPSGIFPPSFIADYAGAFLIIGGIMMTYSC